MEKQTLFALVVGVITGQNVLAQSFGGQRVFPFLGLPTHARVAALGGQVASATRPDGVYFQNNPALADSLPDNQLSLSFMPYLAAAKYYTIQYGLPVKRKNAVWAAGLQYLSYGQFDLTDPQGNTLGTFTANDYALSLTHARTEGDFSLGATVKAVGSSIETYSAFGLMADFGAVWRHPKRELSVGLVAKNAGVLLRNFGPSDADLPFDLQAGITVKPRYAPVRLTLTGYQLHRFDIVYNDPALNLSYDLNGNVIPRKMSVANRLAHHLIVGAEFLFSRNVNVMVAYNHRQRQEGKLLRGAGLAGLSFGASVQARAFQFTYARFVYAPTSGGSSQLSVRMDLARLL
ncbi:MAG: type IX secretion system protein PorQ [Rudanella sp.]|nr:type IX secretion system protein PorQ [Rudanella sp.]